MFPARYFNAGTFAPRYFPKVGASGSTAFDPYVETSVRHLDPRRTVDHLSPDRTVSNLTPRRTVLHLDD